jgi:hypothetical protein
MRLLRVRACSLGTGEGSWRTSGDRIRPEEHVATPAVVSRRLSASVGDDNVVCDSVGIWRNGFGWTRKTLRDRLRMVEGRTSYKPSARSKRALTI